MVKITIKDHVYLCLLCIGSSVMTAFDPIINMEHESILGGCKCLYYLTKREQAHHTNYPALLDLAELLGCNYFKKLRVMLLWSYWSYLHYFMLTSES